MKFRKLRSLVTAISLLFSASALAQDSLYAIDVTRVIDGDTVVADVHAGFGIVLVDRKVRILGVDTPELRSRIPKQKMAAYRAKDFTTEFVERPHLYLQSGGKVDSFGRILGDVRDAKGVSLSQSLLDGGYGVPYAK